jgi:hypothetical protein
MMVMTGIESITEQGKSIGDHHLHRRPVKFIPARYRALVTLASCYGTSGLVVYATDVSNQESIARVFGVTARFR